ncbi:MAG: hypothetical protein Q8N88_04325 [Nanoarchaeota archaeon]|nr:hypothetical protein [Nanoarchaeota archaeon]
MEKNKCKYYETCNAPLCLLDKESLEEGIWYPDEGICRKRTSLKWIRKQKKLVKRKANPELYFNVETLNTSARVGKDPNASVREELKKDQVLEKGESIRGELCENGNLALMK